MPPAPYRLETEGLGDPGRYNRLAPAGTTGQSLGGCQWVNPDLTLAIRGGCGRYNRPATGPLPAEISGVGPPGR